MIQYETVSLSDQIEDSAHEILLSSSVTPIVTFKSIKNVFLGKPFSPNCIPSFATNNYTVYEKPRSKVKRHAYHVILVRTSLG